ncbi:UDP-N-acetylglucosamine transferase subunit ALG14 isoform X1 [Ambystoma mexicanum]|uniref:UDP-N-acetylglucosamine transferase subunit ALG14 isoform X1 n=1 Tax=Ambystoma mexicanum TaxID=8296 RepID=UPI0037E8C1B9
MAVLAMLGCALLALLLVVSARLYLLLRKRVRPGRSGSVSLLVVAGSGGHTSEILRLLSCLSHAYSPTHYVVAESDTMSEDKICRFEKARAKECCKSSYSIHRIPRSREVLQSWSSSVLTTLHSMFYCLILTFKLRPDVMLCNGPGTCVPVCASALLLGLLGIKKVLIVYVESICRVETLSLSGRILYHFSDHFIVQWPSLKLKYPKSLYLGRIV